MQETIPVSPRVRFIQTKLNTLRNSHPTTPELKHHFAMLLDGINTGVKNETLTFEEIGTSPAELEQLKNRVSC